MRRFKASLDQAAFEQLVEDYASPAKAVAYQILCDRVLAEDAVQETFIRLIEKRNQYTISYSFSPWFYVILRNVCIDMIRKRQRDRNFARKLYFEKVRGASFESRCEDLNLLKTLASRERQVLELRVVNSMSFKEIAAALGISEDAAKKRAQRGLRRLRERLSCGRVAQRHAI